MYKVFFNEVPVIITANVNNIAGYNHLEYLKIGDCRVDNIYRILSDNPTVDALVCSGSDQKGNFEAFKKQFTFIEAAGGVVFNDQNQLLAIKRLGKWDLPKGKWEKGESIEDCAVREVSEECGIPEPAIMEKLPETYHVYKLKGKYVLKCTYWFKMKSEGIHRLKPQTEEDISEVVWLQLSDIQKFKTNTYASVLNLLSTIDI